MRDALQHAANQIISGTVGQVIDKAGYTSIGTGLGLKVASIERKRKTKGRRWREK